MCLDSCTTPKRAKEDIPVYKVFRVNRKTGELYPPYYAGGIHGKKLPCNLDEVVSTKAIGFFSRRPVGYHSFLDEKDAKQWARNSLNWDTPRRIVKLFIPKGTWYAWGLQLDNLNHSYSAYRSVYLKRAT